MGELVVSVLCPAIGVIGTYVVAVILCIICLVIITEKSFIRSVKKAVKKPTLLRSRMQRNEKSRQN